MAKLFEPLVAPDFIPLRNRVVMSAMSRSFADKDRCPTEAVVRYYEKRAAGGAGLILTEGTIVHPSGDGWKNAPYITEAKHERAWRRVVDAVHASEGSIACQLWHMGRISHEDFTNAPPVSSTNHQAAGINRQNNKPYGTPRALDTAEMPVIYGYFVDAARRAIDAGFDAVELHMGHGYLVDQFLDGNVNDRSDRYGGSVENRCRFALELVEAVTREVSGRRVIARISPSRLMGGLYEWPDLDDMLSHLIPCLSQLGLGALDVSCANSDYFATAGRMVRKIRPLYAGVILAGASLSPEQAEVELESGMVDAITWGRSFIANPDLANRIRRKVELLPFEESMRGTLH